jgi:hypothetical protein
MKKKATPSPKPKATKKATPSSSAKTKLGPLPKNPTLDDYLMRGIKVPIAPGQKKLPSDSDIVLKKYKKKK